jgi:hypothetical protein
MDSIIIGDKLTKISLDVEDGEPEPTAQILKIVFLVLILLITLFFGYFPLFR